MVSVLRTVPAEVSFPVPRPLIPTVGQILSFSLMFRCFYILTGPFKCLLLPRRSSSIQAAKVLVTLSPFCQAIMVFVPGDPDGVPVTVCRLFEAASSKSQLLPFIPSPELPSLCCFL